MATRTLFEPAVLPQPTCEGGKNLDFPCSKTWRGNIHHKGKTSPSWLVMENQQRIDRIEAVICQILKAMEDMEKANDN